MLVSLQAVYNWDNSVFDDLVIPEGMDRETLIHGLLHETRELSLLYSEPEELKTNIKYYSQSRLAVWEHLWALANAEYNPLDNYMRTQTETTQHGHKEASEYSNTAERTATSNNKVFGFDSETSVGKDSNSGNVEGENSGETTIQHSGVDIVPITAPGNTGVTSYQQMIEGEFNVRPKLDLYNYIITDFKHEFCIMIY